MLEKILRLSCHMSETRDLQPLLVYAVDVALELFNAEHGYLVVKEPDGSLDFWVKRRCHGHEIAEPEVSHQILDSVLTEGKPVAAANALEEFDTSSSVQALHLRSVMCVPLTAHNDVIGALYLDHRLEQGVFSSTDLKFLQLFANQAAVSIENAILNEDLEARIQARTAELQATNLCLQKEMSERQKVQQQLIKMALERERVKILTTFIQDASHQFYTPLSVINTSIHLLNRKIGVDPRYLSHIEAAVQIISDLVRSLVLMVELDGGLGEPVTRIDLGHLGYQVLAQLESKSASKQLLATSDCEVGTVMIQGNLKQVGQAIYQLVLNSVQYTPIGGQVALRVYSQDEMAVVEVSDTGIGIDSTELPFIFNRFYRGDKAGTTRGLGLGLSIAQKVAENHQGHIEVQSQPDIGSTFRLVLPAEDMHKGHIVDLP